MFSLFSLENDRQVYMRVTISANNHISLGELCNLTHYSVKYRFRMKIIHNYSKGCDWFAG